jgi:hypothetical protein
VAGAIGCSRQTVTRVLSDRGKLEARQFERTPGPEHLSLADREEISLGLRGGETTGAIALRLGPAPSTVSRESPAMAASRTIGRFELTMVLMNDRVDRKPKRLLLVL